MFVAYVSPEPELGHFGIGGLKHGEGMLKMFLKKEKIDAVLDNVYAVGIAAAVDVPWHTSNPVGIPKTGFPTEQQAHVCGQEHLGPGPR